jgi:hypothetical protein
MLYIYVAMKWRFYMDKEVSQMEVEFATRHRTHILCVHYFHWLLLIYEKDCTIWNVSRDNGHFCDLLNLSFRISALGSLYISNISQEDAGTYECSAVNSNGRTRAQGHLRVKGKFM